MWVSVVAWLTSFVRDHEAHERQNGGDGDEPGKGRDTASRKFRSSYVADAGGSVSEAMHAVSRRRI
jgi:hypothetical protein